LLDVPVLEGSVLELTDDALVFSTAAPLEGLRLSAERRGWIRRLVPAGWDHDVRIGSHDAAIKASWLSLLAFVIRASRTTWLSDLDATVAAENKLLQYRAARRLGASVPRTVVCSDPVTAASLVGHALVVKPLGPGHFYAEDGPKVVFTTELRPESIPATEFARAPFIVQERIKADRHLRVVTVDRRAWGCELTAEGRSLDWRADEDAHHSFACISLSEELEASALALARELGCGFSSQDWIVAAGTPYFIDLNPSGQWLFLPQETALGVADAIASWLVAR
jgi:glutathione synthase/RimK-type ligase-like ATP-grasp enzyme